MTDYTTNFNLEKYQTGDAANLTDQYNVSMDIIDDNMYKINTNANTAGGKATQALETAQNNTKNLTALGVTNTTTATQLKNKIDTTATNLVTTTETANNAANNLNALGANTVENATNLKNRINDTYTKNESDNRYLQIPNTQDALIAIGDSYFEGFRTTTPATDSMIAVASRLLGLTCHNFAVGGTGFHNGDTTGDNTFSKQLNKAAARITDKTSVKYVVIGGGRNDPDSLTYNEVADTLTKAKTLFPDSEICFIPMLWDNTYPTGKSHNYSTMLNAGNYTDTWTVQDAPSWGLYRDNEMTDIHPNTSGSARYGHYIANILKHHLTAQPRVERWESINKDPDMTNTNVSECNVYINGTTVTINMRAHLIKWSTDAIYQINGASTLGIWKIMLAWFDDATPVRVKFDGHKLSVVDVFTGSAIGGPNKILNAYFTFNIMDF